MENIPDSPTPAEAQEALSSIEESKSRLADHVKSPWWLYPVQGIGVAAFIVGIAFSKYDIGFGSTALVIAIMLFCILPLLQQTPKRVIFDVYTHRSTRGLAVIYVLLLLALVVAAVWVLSAAGPVFAWAVFLAAGAGLALTVIIGPLMDTRLEHAIRAGHQ